MGGGLGSGRDTTPLTCLAGSDASEALGARHSQRLEPALNQAMASYATRHADLAAIVMAPGWIRTELGGANAPVGVEEAMPQIVDVLVAQQDAPGLRYLDRFGKTVPW